MTQPHSPAAGGTPPAINEMLTPTYWGSLSALIIGLALTVAGAIQSGPPAHVQEFDQRGLAAPLFFGALAYVFLFTLRYYCAVCVNVYGESDHAVFEWPRGAPRRLGFASLSVIVLLSISSVGAVIALGITASLLICRLMATISFLVFLAIKLLSRIDRPKYGDVSTAFGLGDLLLGALTWWAIASLSDGATETTVLGLFVMAAVLGIVLAVEFKRLYWNEFRKQFRALITLLDQ